MVKRVPELVPEDVAKKSGYKLDQAVPVATVNELADYDTIIFGTPTGYRNMFVEVSVDEALGLVGELGATGSHRRSPIPCGTRPVGGCERRQYRSLIS